MIFNENVRGLSHVALIHKKHFRFFAVIYQLFITAFSTFYLVHIAGGLYGKHIENLTLALILTFYLVSFLTNFIFIILRLNSIYRENFCDRFTIFFLATQLYNYIVCFSWLYCSFGLRDSTANTIVHDWFISLYFSCVTITTLGYGDYAPARNITRLLAAFEAISGYVILAFSITVLPIILKSLVLEKKSIQTSNKIKNDS